MQQPDVWTTTAVNNSNNDEFSTSNNDLSNYMSLNPVVGIDFGTSNSSVAVWHLQKSRTKVIRTKRYNGSFDAKLL